MDPIHMSSSAEIVTLDDMCLMVRLGTTGRQKDEPPPPPPSPPAQLRATRPRRRGAVRLQTQDYHPGPEGEMSLRDMFLMAGCV
eukprot:12292740-Karenia_brevis.AAC.1